MINMECHVSDQRRSVSHPQERTQIEGTGCGGPETKAVTTGWRKLQNEELHNHILVKYYSGLQNQRINWASYVARMGQMRNS